MPGSRFGRTVAVAPRAASAGPVTARPGSSTVDSEDWASGGSLQLPDAVVRAIDAFFGPRASDVDAGRASVRDGIVELARLGAFEADLAEAVAIVARVARHDLASAFSAWAHRSVVEYLEAAAEGVAAGEAWAATDPTAVGRWLDELRTGRRLGATAMAAGTAHVLAGTPLPVSASRVDGHLELRGRVPWASNLLPPFLVVTAVARADGAAAAIVVALPSEVANLRVEPHPDLLALNATGSSSLRLDGVPVTEERVLAADLGPFVGRILAPFLLVQSAFCIGLAERALEEAETALGPLGAPLRPDLDGTRRDHDQLVGQLAALARRASIEPTAIPRRELLELRLEAARVAGEAVRFELAAVGGRAYVRGHPTERRLREAAFLPIQSPTEVLLRWLLSRDS